MQFIREKIQKYIAKQTKDDPNNSSKLEEPLDVPENPETAENPENPENPEKTEKRRRRRRAEGNGPLSKSSPNISRRKLDAAKSQQPLMLSENIPVVPESEPKRRIQKSERRKSKTLTQSVQITNLDLNFSALVGPNPSEPAIRGKNTSVILKPLGNTECKVFGRDLDDLMRSQQETHPQLLIPAFLETSGRIIRTRCKAPLFYFFVLFCFHGVLIYLVCF
jgi:hypothetical protein